MFGRVRAPPSGVSSSCHRNCQFWKIFFFADFSHKIFLIFVLDHIIKNKIADFIENIFLFQIFFFIPCWQRKKYDTHIRTVKHKSQIKGWTELFLEGSVVKVENFKADTIIQVLRPKLIKIDINGQLEFWS